jgi:hypothetical protein
MKLFFIFSIVASSIMLSPISVAQDKACMIEGTMTIVGISIHAKDCMQSDPKESEKQFKTSCEQLAQASVAFGGKAGEITYMPTCVKPSQGICEGMGGSKRDAYYYARPANDLKNLPKSCEMMGGKWKSGR